MPLEQLRYTMSYQWAYHHHLLPFACAHTATTITAATANNTNVREIEVLVF